MGNDEENSLDIGIALDFWMGLENTCDSIKNKSFKELAKWFEPEDCSLWISAFELFRVGLVDKCIVLGWRNIEEIIKVMVKQKNNELRSKVCEATRHLWLLTREQIADNIAHGLKTPSDEDLCELHPIGRVYDAK